MPQPKSSSGRSRGKRARTPPRPDENTTRGIASLRELLTRAVMLPTDLVREALDDAARRGRMTRADAEDLAQSLIAAGRRQTEDVIADLEQLLGRPRRATQKTNANDTPDPDAFPIPDYDQLAAAQITSRLDDLSPAQLRKVRDYERRHGNRKTVLSAIERKLA